MNPHHRGPRTAHTLVLAAATTLLIASCGSDEQSGNTTAAPAAPAAASIDISGVWARTSPMVAEAAAVYLTIDNTGGLDDALIGASVDPSIAKTAELHETVAVDATASTMAGDTAMSTSGTEAMAGAEPMMEMRPVDRVVAPAGGSVALAPGGYHIMLKELVAPLTVGSTLDVTLTFETSGDKVVTASVRDTAP
jgi:periplasmic copper chaperone A